jgi:hypothetical protein
MATFTQTLLCSRASRSCSAFRGTRPRSVPSFRISVRTLNMGCEPWLPEKYPAKHTKKEGLKAAKEDIKALIQSKHCNPILVGSGLTSIGGLVDWTFGLVACLTCHASGICRSVSRGTTPAPTTRCGIGLGALSSPACLSLWVPHAMVGLRRGLKKCGPSAYNGPPSRSLSRCSLVYYGRCKSVYVF